MPAMTPPHLSWRVFNPSLLYKHRAVEVECGEKTPGLLHKLPGQLPTEAAQVEDLRGGEK